MVYSLAPTWSFLTHASQVLDNAASTSPSSSSSHGEDQAESAASTTLSQGRMGKSGATGGGRDRPSLTGAGGSVQSGSKGESGRSTLSEGRGSAAERSAGEADSGRSSLAKVSNLKRERGDERRSGFVLTEDHLGRPGIQPVGERVEEEDTSHFSGAKSNGGRVLL